MNLCMLTFCIISGLSVLHTMLITKTTNLSFISEGGNFWGFTLNVIWLLGKLTAIRILGWQHEKIARMLRALEKYENAYPNVGRFDKLENLSCFIMAAIAATGVQIILEMRKLGKKKALLVASHMLTKCLYIWGDEKMNEKTGQSEVKDGTELTPKTAVIGWIIIGSEIASILQTGFVLGLMLFFAVTLHAHVDELMKDIRVFGGGRRIEKIEEWRRSPWKNVAFWRKFRILQEVFQTVNALLGTLFKLLFLAGLLAVWLFLSLSFWDTPLTYYGIFFVHLCFLEGWFFYLGKISEQNDEITEWIRTCAIPIGTVNVDGFVVHPREVLEEMERKPIGFGIGKLAIRYTFHYHVLKIFKRAWNKIFGSGDDN